MSLRRRPSASVMWALSRMLLSSCHFESMPELRRASASLTRLSRVSISVSRSPMVLAAVVWASRSFSMVSISCSGASWRSSKSSEESRCSDCSCLIGDFLCDASSFSSDRRFFSRPRRRCRDLQMAAGLEAKRRWMTCRAKLIFSQRASSELAKLSARFISSRT